MRPLIPLGISIEVDLAAGFTSQANVMIGSVTGSQGHETSLIAGVIDAARVSTFFPGSVRQPDRRAGVSVEGVGGGGRRLSPRADRPDSGQQAATVADRATAQRCRCRVSRETLCPG